MGANDVRRIALELAFNVIGSGIERGEMYWGYEAGVRDVTNAIIKKMEKEDAGK